MKIVVTGLRGFPNIQGGIETHCEQLYPRLVRLGADVTVIRRTCFIEKEQSLDSYKGVKFKDLSTPKIKGVEAALHTLKSVFYAYKVKADLVHIHAIGPSIVIPAAKLLGLKVVMTHHGPDYDRKNWGSIAKFILKTGEYFAAKWADEIIVISTVINNILISKYNRHNASLIHNGVEVTPSVKSCDYINTLGIKSRKYVLAVGRFVKEKEFDKLIQAFLELNLVDYQLVIAGDSDHEDAYSLFLKKFAKENGVILTGVIKGDKLNEIYSHAALFVLPSSHEGLPITLLEAMSYGIDTLVSDIPANLAVNLPTQHYFKLNDIAHLKRQIFARITQCQYPVSYDLTAYNWDYIATQTHDVYKRALLE